MVKVFVNGYSGKMGNEIIQAVEHDEDLELVGKAGSKDNLAIQLEHNKPDVVIDFTNPDVAFRNAEVIIHNKCNAIIGTTGITTEQRKKLDILANENKVAILIAPNFCIGAVLMMKLAAEAAKYLPNVEIIEYHHDEKADAPSGTAITTAEYINKKVVETNPPTIVSKEMLQEPAQGARVGNIRIHAVRLPGFLASQEILLGDKGHVLKIRHDTISRESFMPGILYATKNIMSKTGLFYGLETLLFPENV